MLIEPLTVGSSSLSGRGKEVVSVGFEVGFREMYSLIGFVRASKVLKIRL